MAKDLKFNRIKNTLEIKFKIVASRKNKNIPVTFS